MDQIGRDIMCGIGAGTVESFLCLTPCQNLSVKMTHDANLPASQQKYKRFFPSAHAIFREYGFRGMFAGAGPTVLKGSINQARNIW